jgi:hypothetical protein
MVGQGQFGGESSTRNLWKVAGDIVDSRLNHVGGEV